jgi:nucleoside-diphosphate-sugar epimerase
MGHGLIEGLAARGDVDVLALDLHAPAQGLSSKCVANIQGDILDKALLQRIASEYAIEEIFHLAALLSTRAEYTPEMAHHVNVDGTLNLLELASEEARRLGKPVKFLFPSSIAAYGLPDLATKSTVGPLKEHKYNTPTTMYGCNKLYCEHLGRYFTLHYKQLSDGGARSGVDFRSIRFPGLISAVTLPAGGTSDFAPEMVHAAAKGEPYACFVDADAQIPFMAMPDGIRALLLLAKAPAVDLTQRVYNINAFSLTAGQIRERVVAAFPGADIRFDRDEKRGRIVDSWPAEVDDGPARRDWGWAPVYDANRAFTEYLVPTIRERYRIDP